MDAHALVVNVDGAVVREDRYLLIERAAGEEHAAGDLGFPGGTVEPADAGEDVLAATVARELREEVGLEVDAVEYVHSGTFEADDGTPCLNVLTLCGATGEAHPREPEEVAAVHWVGPDEARAREDVPAYTEGYVERLEAYRR